MMEKNITLLLNCSCNNLKMNKNKIEYIDGWQMTTYTWHRVYADYFIDCSGDSVLAPMCGAEFRVGRESNTEFDEKAAPDKADRKTMGMSCLLQARETTKPVKYIPPSWANIYESDDDLPYRGHDLSSPLQNFWWLELGGEQDTIHDTEEIRDELLKVVFGVWDHIKNRGDHGAENWDLDWVGFLPGKRESRRYMGDYILTQNDIMSGGKFDDLVAYGGWPLDDHNPAGFKYPGKPNISFKTPSPYGIPYRCMYSKNIDNLMFAGRNISTSHVALSSSRVIATCAIIGQAVGTAVSIAAKNSITPRDIYTSKIKQLQQALMDDDCYLPWNSREISDICRSSKLIGESNKIENLRNGKDRIIEDENNGCTVNLGSDITYVLNKSSYVDHVRIVFDSNFDRSTCSGNKVLRFYPSVFNHFLNTGSFGFPTTMVKSFDITYTKEDGSLDTISITDNHQRFVKIPLKLVVSKITLKIKETYGDDTANIFSFDFR
jgi:hypothetical protein